ncbi:uncharacterized skeletal organic matrix protein 5 [Nematostella vectensis]|uniref:uncharacterized skeletal organic matrix protein 5 n=1 Tax=Nematostella vectensis TaxID=45351 RepID=UPI002076F3FE|nr:uncharacterized skeletal organic matrix protein 5 [Nematostella vectensis]
MYIFLASLLFIGDLAATDNVFCDPNYHDAIDPDFLETKICGLTKRVAEIERSIATYTSCRELKNDGGGNNGNMAYTLTVGGRSFDAYCHMDELVGCGAGPWTLAMKVDGGKRTFNYNSAYWTDENGYNLNGGVSLGSEETKLPTFWATTTKEICIGMQDSSNNEIKWMSLPLNSTTTLMSLFNGGHYETKTPYSKWRELVGTQEATLQRKCRRSGFNAKCGNDFAARARIGIVGDESDDCYSCDSVIGIGIDCDNYWQHYSAGNMCDYWCSDASDSGAHVPAYFMHKMSYVLVK